ncbi:MAG: glycosyltransferase family 2 protein [Deltaproteobacteria bacterium]|nr:glycosyltransferase family 2 protein [Deltaproteobacteria bacterium]
MDLSVVVPVKNEEENIDPLVDELCSALDGLYQYEIVYVDDGSSDETWERLVALSKGLSQLTIIRHRGSYGQSNAILTGVKAARSSLIVTLDGDGQNDPADIPTLVEVFKAPNSPPDLQLVVGHRRKRMDSWVKRVSARVANGVRGYLLKDGTPDTGCGLKLFPREIFLGLPFFNHMHRFLPALIQRSGGAVVSVEVNHRPRKHGRSHYGIWDRLWVGLVDLCGVMWLQRRSKVAEIEEVINFEN